MKHRLLHNWTFIRALYVCIGLAVMIQSVINMQWLVVIIGGYFASMGLFNFGCAAGNCYGRSCLIETETSFETVTEIKEDGESSNQARST